MLGRLAVATAAAVAATAAAAAPATAADSWPVPASGTTKIAVTGHGFGHGRGMSQYGAQYAATHGNDYRAIMAHYYPGTSWGTATGSIRVWISRDLTNDVQVQSRSGLVARRTGTSTTWNLTRAKPRADRWRVLPSGDRASILQYRLHGWHQYRKVGGLLELTASGQPIRLYTADGSTRYRGVLRSVPSSPGNRITVNVLPLETYLRGVVPAESIASAWDQQALRAQAVAARTYAAHARAKGQRTWDICETQSCQVYRGADVEYPTTDRAVAGTARRILTYDGRPAFTEFSASNGGWSTVGSTPYLTAQQDPWETSDNTADPYQTWRANVTDKTVEKAWPGIGNLTDIAVSDRDGNGQWGGRAGTVTLTGGKGTKTLTGSDFAKGLGLRSTWFTLTVG